MHRVESKSISAHAAIALVAAILEKLLPSIGDYQEVSTSVRHVADELWRWQTTPSVRGHSTWTEADALALPSGVLYWEHHTRLVDLVGHCADPRRRRAIGAAIVSLTFAIWLIDAEERYTSPGKPQVLGNDVAEVSWETLQLVLDTAIQGATDSAEMSIWLEKVMDRLAKSYPRPKNPHDFGQPIPRNKFPGL